MDVEQIILDMIKNNKQNFESPLYNHDEYATGYYEGANDILVSLLDNLGIKHNEDIINKIWLEEIKMKEAKHCYVLSNGVSVVVGDRVELIANNGERYIGDIYDITENSISCTLVDGTGEAGFFFKELEDVRLVK